MYGKRKRKDTSYISNRYLRRLAAQESTIVSRILVHDISSSCENMANECRTDLKNDYMVNSEIINIEHDMKGNENNETLAQSGSSDTFEQSDEGNTSDAQESSVSSSYNESNDVVFKNRNIADTTLQHDLATWAVEHQITHTALRALLQRLRKHSCFSTLVLDARALLKTPRQQQIRTIAPGSYYHFGLLQSITKILALVKDDVTDIRIAVNIDGLPLSKSSQQQFWPILGSVLPYDNVFIIGIYHGNEKPANVNEFLQDFVNEAKEICGNGFYVNGQNIPCRIAAIICDTPAKSFVLSIKGHAGYSSCTKCITEGQYVGNRLCFPQMDASLRSDNDFIQKTDDNFHKPGTTCSLLNIPHFKPVTHVPLDYMHLICLGIVRKLLNLLLHGELSYRLQSRVVDEISTHLTLLKPSIPVEFARKPRKLDCMKLWKATEYRLLLLYTGPLVFKSVLKKKFYIHFMALHVIMRILSSEDLLEYITYAQDLIHFFIKTFIKLYGVHNVSHNVHSLVHLVDDVKKFGPVNNFSALKFENYMQILKKYVRKAEKPLQQIVRRYIEKERILHMSPTLSDSVSTYPLLTSLHFDGPLLLNCCNPQYKIIKYKVFTLKVGTLADSCCGLNCGAIISIKNVAYCVQRNIPVIIGYESVGKGDLFTAPCLSSMLGIYSVHFSSHLKSWPLKHVVKKYVQLPYRDDKYAVFPLLHC